MWLKKYEKFFKGAFAAIFIAYMNLFIIHPSFAQLKRETHESQWGFFSQVVIRGGFADPSRFGSTSGVVAIVASIVSVVLSLVGTVFIIMVIYGGFLWLTARGNKETTDKARKIITDAAIGAAIVIGAYIITYFIVESLAASMEA